MHFLDLAAILYWPAFALGGALVFFLWKAPTRKQRAIGAGVVALSGAVGVFIPGQTGFGSLVTVFNVNLGHFLVGAALAVVTFFFFPERPADTGKFKWILMRYFGGSMAVFFSVWGAWSLAGDFLLPRRIATGVVAKGETTRFGNIYPKVTVILDNGERFYLTQSIAPHDLQIGHAVRAEVGRGSKFAYSLVIDRPWPPTTSWPPIPKPTGQ